MSALSEFLLARIADDNALANAITAGTQGEHPPIATNGLYWTEQSEFADLAITQARLLAECSAKRELVHFLSIDADPPSGPGIRTADDLTGAAMQVLRVMARPYADHVEYDESWRL